MDHKPPPIQVGPPDDPFLTVLASFGSSAPPSTDSNVRLSFPASSSSQSHSGEFNSFSFVGTSLSGGGTTRRLFYVATEGQGQTCMGFIGDDAAKACIKSVSGLPRSCGISKHATKKFVAQSDHFYIRTAESAILCKPALDASMFTDEQIEKLKQESFSTDRWLQIFEDLLVGITPVWLREDPNAELPEVEPESKTKLETPVAAVNRVGIFSTTPSLSFSSSFDSENSKPGEVTELTDESFRVLVTRMSKVQGKIKSMCKKWSTPFSEIEASHLMVSKDLEKLETEMATLTTNIGHKKQDGDASISVWDAIQVLRSAVQNCETQIGTLTLNVEPKLTELNRTIATNATLARELQNAVLNQRKTEAALAALERQNAMFLKRFEVMQPLLVQLASDTRFAPTDRRNDDWREPVRALQEQVTQMSLGCAGLPDSMPGGYNMSEFEAVKRDFEARFTLLEQRIGGVGVAVGSLSFQSFEDLSVWVRNSLPTGRYGLFVDGVSLFEYFGFMHHIDTETSVAAMHNSSKTGFATMFETRAATSMQNCLPTVFGKRGASEGVDDAEGLPGITDPDKWDNGTTGIKHQILKSMNDVSLQIDSNIDKVFRNHSEARQLARDCLTNSKRFVIDFVNFLSQEMFTWRNRGHSKKEFWRMASKEARRVFEELQTARVSARDRRDSGDVHYTTATIIYAIMMCHGVMEAYLKGQFVEHPSISAVLARHLADNYVKPEDNPTSKLSALDAKVTKLASKIDSLTSTVANLQPGGTAKKWKGKGGEDGA